MEASREMEQITISAKIQLLPEAYTFMLKAEAVYSVVQTSLL